MTRIAPRILHVSLACSLVLAAGCDTPWETVDPESGVPVLALPEGIDGASSSGVGKVSAALTRATSCDAMAAAIRQQAVADVIDRTQQAFASAWQRLQYCTEDWHDRIGLPGADAGVAMPAPTNQGADGPDGHSETNNQVAGVDEADIVKTDGEHIYLLGNGALRIVRSWPADQTEIVASVPIHGTPKKLFVLGDRLLVYASAAAHDPYASSYATRECTYGYDCVPTGDGHPTRITLLDISDRSAPRPVRQIELSSSLLAARRIGSAVHTVVTEPASSPIAGLSFWPEGLDYDVCDTGRSRLYRAFVALLAANIRAVNETQTETLFPTATDSLQQAVDPFAGCGSFYRASLGDGQQYTSIVSLDMAGDEPLSAVTIFSPPGIVYASAESLYLAVQRTQHADWRWGWFAGMDGVTQATTIHRFALGHEPAAASYAASGLVKGRLLNQFALDEHAGHLRVASTIGRLGASGNELTVLAQQGRDLARVGLIAQLAPTEDIRSVRFDGERGYVVTFKETDPLFVLDLSLPSAPKVLAELKIPGFSTYMHKMDETHLLTIGYDGDDEGSFAWFNSVALQIFDVADPTRPRLVHKHVIGTRGSSSEALTNHLAFTYYAPKNLLALPITICEGGGGGSYGDEMTFSGLLLLDVTAAAGFSLRGQVSHPMTGGYGCHNWWTNASSQVKRTLVIDNFVYSISDTLLKVNDLDAPSPDLVSLPLE